MKFYYMSGLRTSYYTSIMAILSSLLIPFGHFVLIAFIIPDILLSEQFLGFITYVILFTVSLVCFGYFELFISTFWLPCFDACIFFQTFY
jgi:hypothetical protein